MAVRWKVNRLGSGVDYPTEDGLSGGPRVIPVSKLLLGDGLLSILVEAIVPPKDFIDRMIGVPADSH